MGNKAENMTVGEIATALFDTMASGGDLVTKKEKIRLQLCRYYTMTMGYALATAAAMAKSDLSTATGVANKRFKDYKTDQVIA